MKRPTTVVVGSSIGGVRTAQALRTAGYTGRVVVVGEERALPYDKPPLSKEWLAGTTTVDALTLLTEGTAAENDIEMILGRAATALDVSEQYVELDRGERLQYDEIIIATGARTRPSPWGNALGVHVLRSLADAEALRMALMRGGPFVIVGAGLIGSEVASTARGLGVESVTVVDPEPVPMSRLFDGLVGTEFRTLHTSRGVDLRLGVGVTSIDAGTAGLRVRLRDGSDLEAATVLIAIGATPNVDWLRSSGLKIDDGVLCDRFCRALGTENVHAVGDVARWWHPLRRELIRMEHWTNAVEQAACVAYNIVNPGTRREYAPTEYVWTRQYEWNVQIAGQAGGGLNPHRIDGPAGRGGFAVLYADTFGRFRGMVTVNWPRAAVLCRRAVPLSPDVSDLEKELVPE